MVAPHESILYRPGPARWTRERLVFELRARLLGGVQQAFLFGSYARESANEDSDIDLIIVTATALPFIRRPFAFLDALQGLGPVDLLVYTPEEWAQMQRSRHSFFEQTAEERVRVI